MSSLFCHALLLLSALAFLTEAELAQVNDDVEPEALRVEAAEDFHTFHNDSVKQGSAQAVQVAIIPSQTK